MLVLDGTRMADELLAMSILRQPEEAVGLLVPDGRIFSLPNRSGDPGSNFEVNKGDILAVIRMHDLLEVEGLTLWHSHPNGGVGPSRIDMQQKLPFFEHLIVTLTADGPVFTWY